MSSSRTLVFPQDPAKVGQDYIWKIYPRRDGWEFMGEEMRTAISDTEDQCRFQWYEYIYGKYDCQTRLQASLDARGGARRGSVDRVSHRSSPPRATEIVCETHLHG